MVKIEKALITGATSGIGEALAFLLSKKGIRLILTGRNHEKLQSIAKMTGAEKTVLADLKEKKGRGAIVSAIQIDLPDLVINNAGFGMYGDSLSIPVDEQEAMLEVNAWAPLEITIEAARALIAAHKKGIILNVSSVAGEHPTPGMAVYGAAKSFLTMVSRALNFELSSKGVDVLVSCPGMVSTDFANRAAKKKVTPKGPSMTADYVASMIWKQINQRKGKKVVGLFFKFGSWFAKYFAPESLVMKTVWKRILMR